MAVYLGSKLLATLATFYLVLTTSLLFIHLSRPPDNGYFFLHDIDFDPWRIFNLLVAMNATFLILGLLEVLIMMVVILVVYVQSKRRKIRRPPRHNITNSHRVIRVMRHRRQRHSGTPSIPLPPISEQVEHVEEDTDAAVENEGGVVDMQNNETKVNSNIVQSSGSEHLAIPVETEHSLVVGNDEAQNVPSNDTGHSVGINNIDVVENGNNERSIHELPQAPIDQSSPNPSDMGSGAHRQIEQPTGPVIQPDGSSGPNAGFNHQQSSSYVGDYAQPMNEQMTDAYQRRSRRRMKKEHKNMSFFIFILIVGINMVVILFASVQPFNETLIDEPLDEYFEGDFYESVAAQSKGDTFRANRVTVAMQALHAQYQCCFVAQYNFEHNLCRNTPQRHLCTDYIKAVYIEWLKTSMKIIQIVSIAFFFLLGVGMVILLSCSLRKVVLRDMSCCMHSCCSSCCWKDQMRKQFNLAYSLRMPMPYMPDDMEEIIDYEPPDDGRENNHEQTEIPSQTITDETTGRNDLVKQYMDILDPDKIWNSGA